MQLKLRIDAANSLKANVSTVEAAKKLQVQIFMPAALPVRWWLLGKELSSLSCLLLPQQAAFILVAVVTATNSSYLCRQQSQMAVAGTFACCRYCC